MEQPTFLDDYNKAVHDISLGQHLKRVIEKQKTQISNLKDWNLMDECLKIEEAYQLMLKFFSEGVKDEKRSEVYELLQKRLLVLAQKIKRKRGIRESSDIYYSKLRFVAHQSYTLQYYTNRLRAVYSQNLFLSITEASKGDDNARETYIEDLFDYVWVMPALTKEEYDELNNMFFNEQFVSDDEKLWLVSALTISTLSFYDERKLRLLVSLSDYENMRVACRATVGLSLVVMYHHELLKVSCPHQLLDFRPDLSATWAMLQVYYLTLSNTKRIRRQSITKAARASGRSHATSRFPVQRSAKSTSRARKRSWPMASQPSAKARTCRPRSTPSPISRNTKCSSPRRKLQMPAASPSRRSKWRRTPSACSGRSRKSTSVSRAS